MGLLWLMRLFNVTLKQHLLSDRSGWWFPFLRKGTRECAHTTQLQRESLLQGVSILFVTFMDRILGRSLGEGIRFGNLTVASLLFVDDVVLLACLNHDLL